MASKKRTDVVNELATDPNPMNEEETMNESVDKTLEETVEALANILPRLSNSTQQ
ncbi:MAG TPA: hypothetical protein PK959_01995 [Candidatus Competibacteraceae bacterium]|nr:hypothetical protein [Candidatus Competibacteraceae bacterium]HSA47906.1 hypothetical protein [Candidatus Competibacteraceae bacterium]